MPTATSLWTTLEERTGQPLPGEVRRCLECLGTVARWQKITAEQDREKLLRAAVRLVQALRESGLLRAEGLQVEVESPSGRRDGRWELWRKLRACAGVAPDGQWSPFTLTRIYDFTADPALHAQRVEVSFDARLSLGSVVANLRRLWPGLRRAGWLRQSHPLGARSLALVEFVCTEMEPDTTWRAMLAAWNERYPLWRYRDARSFEKAFRRAEGSLAGEPYGLEWFYRLQARPEVRGEPTVRQAMAMLSGAATEEDRRYLRRLDAPFAAGASDPSLAFGARIRWAHERAAGGLSAEQIADELLEQLAEAFGEEPPESRRQVALKHVRGLLEQDPTCWPTPGPEPGETRVEYSHTRPPLIWEDDHTVRVVSRYPPMRAD